LCGCSNLDVGECRFSGSLSFLSALTQLTRFVGKGNLFASTLPSDIGHLRSLRYVTAPCPTVIARRPLSESGSDFKAELCVRRVCSMLEIQRNAIEGNIPDSISKCKDLDYINLSSNRINDARWYEHTKNVPALRLVRCHPLQSVRGRRVSVRLCIVCVQSQCAVH
jgi:hypothetical protein